MSGSVDSSGELSTARYLAISLRLAKLTQMSTQLARTGTEDEIRELYVEMNEIEQELTDASPSDYDKAKGTDANDKLE